MLIRTTMAALVAIVALIVSGCGGSGGSNVGNFGPAGNAQPVLTVSGMSGANPNYSLAVQVGNPLPGNIVVQGSDANSGDVVTLRVAFNPSSSSGYASLPAALSMNPAPAGTPAASMVTETAPTNAIVTISPNGALNTEGTIVLDVQLNDDKGGATGATLTITVSSGTVNNDPALQVPTGPGSVSGNAPNYSTTVNVGASLNFSVTATDPDGDNLTLTASRTGGSLTASAAGFTTSFPASSVGTAPRTLNVSGTAAAAGTIELSISVTDGNGGSANATLFITIQSGGGSNPTPGSVPTNGSGGGTGTVNGTYQSRPYRLNVPSSYTSSTPMPLVIALHGSGDTHTNFHSTMTNNWVAASNSNNFILMTPAASGGSFLQFPGGQFSQSATQNELTHVRDAAYYGVGATHNIETTQIYVIGFSEGAVATEFMGIWFNQQIKAIAPYAGAIDGKPSVTRKIPVYSICGTNDFSYSQIVSAHQEWVTMTHPANNQWVQGVGHTFSQLHANPTASQVYQWMSAQTTNLPVTSAFQGGGSNPNPSGDGSGGSGGAYPGNQSRTVAVSGLGSQTYHLYIPSSYDPATPMPLIFAFHGQAGAGNADAAAQQVRNDWATVAASNGFIVVAMVATGQQSGSWIVSDVADTINAVIPDVQGAYNIHLKRRYMWGFSAGGHLAHLFGLSNPMFFAAYGVSAGDIGSLAGQYGWSPSNSLTSQNNPSGRRIPVSLYVGTTDPLRNNMIADRNAFQSAGWTLNTNLWYTEFTGGHTYSTAHLSQIWAHISTQSLP